MTYSLRLIAFMMAALCFSACQPAQAPKSNPVRTSGTADIGGPFTLVNHLGEPVTFETYQGKPQLIYFGFAFCPDICPTSLQQMGTALDILGEDADKFQPLFFSIDPERDTPGKLALYVTASGFPDNLVALTGTQEQVDAAIKAYRIYAKRAPDPQSAAGYTMDHASMTYLMDDKGQFVDVFPHNTAPPVMAKRLRRYLKTGA